MNLDNMLVKLEKAYRFVTNLEEKEKRFSEEIISRREIIKGIEKQTKKFMRNGERFNNEAIDYCFWHGGLEGLSNKGKVEEFLNSLKEYGGQLILENSEGLDLNTSTTSIEPHIADRRNGRTIVYGRLQKNKPYKIDSSDRNLIALTDSLRLFEFGKINSPLLLDDYLEVLLNDSLEFPSDYSTTWEKILESREGDKNKPIHRNKKPQGIYLDIYSSLIPEMTLGENRPYNYEPHESLIIGDEAVKHYLSEENLKLEL